MKRKYLMISVAVLALGMGSTAYAGQWKTNAEGWWYQEDDGSRPINTWSVGYQWSCSDKKLFADAGCSTSG